MTGASDLDPDERREELLRAPKSEPADAAPRITATEAPSGATRIDVADTAAVRPGGGTTGGADTSARGEDSTGDAQGPAEHGS